MDGIVLAPGEGRRVSERLVTKAGPDEIVVTETDFEAGRRGPPPHVHKLHADSFEYLVADRRHDESETEFLARFDTYYVDRPHPADT